MTLVILAADIGRWLVLAAAALTLIRLALGPGAPDRAVALDLLSILVAVFAALTAIVAEADAYLDVAMTIALAGFLATLAFAALIARRTDDGGRDDERR
jgi:multisubunit Na+/H+ antiporter MnhF subunit